MAIRVQNQNLQFSDNALTILYKRYLRDGESPYDMLRRVADGDQEIYELMADLKFLPNSPTLMNAGTGVGTLSACFKFDVPDSLDGIMHVLDKAAKVMKWGGGVGYALGDVRAKGSLISSTGGQACGPVEAIRWFHTIAGSVQQGGKRPGAQMAILPIDHPDIREFIHMKDADPQALSSFNISVAVTDEYMCSLVPNAAMSVDSPNRLLWERICDSAWATGDPGLYFIDRAERDNPTPEYGALTGTNPCGEVPLLDNEACNLGSLNLAAFKAGSERIDWRELGDAVRAAVRFLDCVIDRNWFPSDEITHAVRRTRKIGLGVMGWADLLMRNGIHYDTPEAVQFGEEIVKFIREMADATASANRTRNATVLCIAPTGTISILAGCSSGIEPHYDYTWTRTMADGTELKESMQTWDREKLGSRPKIANEIPWEWHVRHQAAFQKHVDLAVSKTINLPETATVEDISAAYQLMWKLGCKGGTVFRTNCRQEQVLRGDSQALPPRKPDPDAVPPTSNGRRRLPPQRPSITHKFEVDGMDGYFHVGVYEDGTPGELFIKVSKEGSTVSGLLDAFGIAASLGLQYGVPLEAFTRKLAGMRFDPAGPTPNPDIPFAASIADYLSRWLSAQFGAEAPFPTLSGVLCPDCGSQARFEDNCLHCTACGWERCG